MYLDWSKCSLVWKASRLLRWTRPLHHGWARWWCTQLLRGEDPGQASSLGGEQSTLLHWRTEDLAPHGKTYCSSFTLQTTGWVAEWDRLTESKRLWWRWGYRGTASTGWSYAYHRWVGRDQATAGRLAASRWKRTCPGDVWPLPKQSRHNALQLSPPSKMWEIVLWRHGKNISVQELWYTFIL